MKSLSQLILLLVLPLALLSCGQSPAEKLAKDTLDAMEDMIDTLNAIADGGDEKALAEDLEDLAKQLKDIRERSLEIEATAEERDEIREKYADEMKEKTAQLLEAQTRAMSSGNMSVVMMRALAEGL